MKYKMEKKSFPVYIYQFVAYWSKKKKEARNKHILTLRAGIIGTLVVYMMDHAYSALILVHGLKIDPQIWNKPPL